MEKTSKIFILLVTLVSCLIIMPCVNASDLVRIGLRNSQFYYLDRDSVVCDIYNPPEYRLHGTIIVKDRYDNKQVGETIYFFRYDYDNGTMYFVEYSNNTSKEEKCIKNTPNNPMLIKSAAGCEMFLAAYGEKFPLR